MPQHFTRTINPLQFEALEPKRFEDMVRQLLYDFRSWRQLEATGRSGGDDGFDARGWEAPEAGIADATTEREEEAADQAARDRIWLIQCKREQQIGPTKLLGYLNDIDGDELERLHGVIFVASADFSKRTRDAFRSWCAEKGIQEFHLWGKAELEDALFQPKNDRLLFAYFGLSLTVRRRSEQARLRARTTIKRKLKRVIEDHNELLIRDASDESYPYTDGREDFPWWVGARPRLTFRGLEILTRRHFAYAADDGEHWDYANKYDDGRLSRHQDRWRGWDGYDETRQELFGFWDELPRQNQGWLEVWSVIPFDRIIEVDELGDDLTRHPHVFVVTNPNSRGPYEFDYPKLTYGNGHVHLMAENRVKKFPAKFRKPLPPQNNGSLKGSKKED